MITQSNGRGLCRRVSQPSYHAPVAIYTPGRWTGACGEMRLEAGAKYSSEVERMREWREADIKSSGGGRGVF